jgi:glycosyltransferase involved in cell wall biosynthesis/tetratricopeptide (TPR) repeat protein
MDKPYRIALAMIVGDAAKAEDWQRLMESVKDVVNGLYVAWTGQGDPPDFVANSPIKHGGMRSFPWQDDFAAARNFSFEMVPRDEYDWIMWLDSDDELIGSASDDPDRYWEEPRPPAECMVAMLDDIRPDTQAIWWNYAYAWNDALDRPRIDHWRERMFRADNVPSWRYMIHEVGAIRPGSITGRSTKLWVRHWFESTPESERATRERNRRIVAKAYGLDPENPRYILMMANEMLAAAEDSDQRGDPTATREARAGAAKLYLSFLEKSPPNDDAYTANNRLAMILRKTGQFDAAINQDLQGVKVRPTWMDSWIGIAEACLLAADYGLARDFADIALSKVTVPISTQAYEPMMYDYSPYLIRGQARLFTGDPAGAVADFEQCVASHPEEEMGHKLLTQAKLALRTQSTDGVTDPVTVERIHRRGSKPERSVAFVVNQLFEPWGPKLIAAGGSGGAEHCVAEIARRFNADGYRVAVFGTPGEERGVDADGIEWWDTREYDPNEQFDVVIASRTPATFDGLVNARVKLLWMHDVNVGDTSTGVYGDSMKNAPFVVALSKWHRHHLMRLYGLEPHRVVVIPNGYDEALFQRNGSPRQRNKYVWASSPDRGVDAVLGVWPELRKRMPEAEFHVYYGWTGIDKIIAQSQPGTPQHDGMVRFKTSVMQLTADVGGEEAGIFWHDRKPRAELAAAYDTCDVWLYPTSFMETFCITAMETQACGVIPLVADVAALAEAVPNERLRIPGFANNESFRKEFVSAITRLDKTPEPTRAALRDDGVEFASGYTWDAAYAWWRDVIAKL